MSHAVKYLDFHCSTREKNILQTINSFAYDPLETDHYHGNLTFHKEPVYKGREAAKEAIKKLCKDKYYSDHAVKYREGRKVYWLIKVEWHC